MAAPQLQVALGDTRIGGQHEHHHMGVGDQPQRQLGLGADRIQARRVKDHQALAQ